MKMRRWRQKRKKRKNNTHPTITTKFVAVLCDFSYLTSTFVFSYKHPSAVNPLKLAYFKRSLLETLLSWDSQRTRKVKGGQQGGDLFSSLLHLFQKCFVLQSSLRQVLVSKFVAVSDLKHSRTSSINLLWSSAVIACSGQFMWWPQVREEMKEWQAVKG